MLNKKPLPTDTLTWLFILAGVILPLSILFFDTPERDECYQALCVLNYKRSPLAPLSFFNGYMWLKFFGVTVLNLRILNLLCHLVAIGLGCWLFFRRTADKLWAAVVFMTLGTASQVWAMHIYNWDTGCYPFAMLCLVASLAFWRNPSWSRLSLLAVCAALFGLSRLPCIVCIPLLAVAVAVRYRGSSVSMCMRTLAFLALSLVVSVLCLLIIYGGPSGVAQAFSPDNIITGHGVNDIERYLVRIKVITPQLAVLSILPLMFMSAAFVMANLRRHRRAIALVLAVGVEAMLLFLFFLVPVHTFFCLLFLPGVFLWLWPVMHRLPATGCFCSPGYTGWLTLLFIVVPIIGSDGFQERFMVLPTIPVLAAVCYPQLKRYIRWFFVYALLGASSMLFVKEVYYISLGMELVGDEVPRLKGVVVDSLASEALREQASVLKELRGQGKRVMIVGDNRYPGSFIHDLDMVADLHIFHRDDFEHDIPVYREWLPEADALMVFYPVYYSMDAITSDVNQNDNDEFERYVISAGFEKSPVAYPNFVMYYRRP